jgi:cytochrome c2
MRPRFFAALAFSLALSGCGSESTTHGGDPERAQQLLRQYGCSSCHRIPGVAGARGNVGPPLDDVARRAYLGGVLPNTPENMAHWIRDPQRFDPLTAMPNMQVTEADARDMATYLSRRQ